MFLACCLPFVVRCLLFVGSRLLLCDFCCMGLLIAACRLSSVSCYVRCLLFVVRLFCFAAFPPGFGSSLLVVCCLADICGMLFAV